MYERIDSDIDKENSSSPQKPLFAKRKLSFISTDSSKKQNTFNITPSQFFAQPTKTEFSFIKLSPHISEISNTFCHQAIGCKVSQQDALITGFVKDFERLLQEKQKEVLGQVCQELQKNYGQYQHSGSTFALCICCGKNIIVANLGDSLIYLIKRDANQHIMQCKRLNNLHNHQDSKDHDLAITHAIGDVSMSGIIHLPEISFGEADANSIILLASDGLTAAASKHIKSDENDEIYIQNLLESAEIKNLPLGKIPEALKKAAIVDGSTDNISIIVNQIDTENSDAKIFAVFDGHGTQGAKTSTALAKNILRILNDKVQEFMQAAELKVT